MSKRNRRPTKGGVPKAGEAVQSAESVARQTMLAREIPKKPVPTFPPKNKFPKRVIHRYAAFFFGLIALFLAWIFVQRHLTWDFLIPFWEVASRNVVPGLITSFLAFLFFFFDESELQKRWRAWLHKVIEKTSFPFWFTLGGVILCGVVASFQFWWTPLQWKSFVGEKFLNGENDKYAAALTVAESLKEDAPEAAGLLAAGLAVFTERARMNHQDQREDVDVGPLRQSVNFLENRGSLDARIDAFRRFALAESASIFGHYKLLSAKAAFVKARAEYATFLAFPPHVTTKQWRESAILNVGNTHYYEGNWTEAEAEWSKLPNNPRLAANRAAALVMMDQPDKGIEVLKEGLDLLKNEPRRETGAQMTRAALVGNLMVALMIKEKPAEAVSQFEDQYVNSGQPADADLEANYALAVLLAGNKARFRQCVSSGTQIVKKTKSLLLAIDSLLSTPTPVPVDHLQEFVGDKRGEKELLEAFGAELAMRGWGKIPPLAQIHVKK